MDLILYAADVRSFCTNDNHKYFLIFFSFMMHDGDLCKIGMTDKTYVF